MDATTAVAVNKNLKHYKKSMIDEYELTSNTSESINSNQASNKMKLNSFQQNHSNTTSSSSSNKKLYCICKSSDTQRFMIACDNCDEWFHGDCVGISETFSKKIKTFYCYICRYRNSNLTIRYKKKFNEHEIKEKFRKEIIQRETKELELCKKLKEAEDLSIESEKQQSNTKSNIVKKDSTSNLETTIDAATFNLTKHYGKSRVSGEDIENFVSAIAKFGSESQIQNKSTTSAQINEEVKIENTIKRQINENENNVNAQNVEQPKTKKSRGGRKKKILNEEHDKEDDEDDDDDDEYNVKMSSRYQSINQYRHHYDQFDQNDDTIKLVKQCLGPECTNSARNSSKYCSDECGIKLAKNRLMKFLKEKNPNDLCKSAADELNEAQLKQINSEIDNVKLKLNELDNKHIVLDKIIQRAKYEKIKENVETEKDTEEFEIFCVTCGHTYNEKHALKHMERCFTKYESQAFFGSSNKSHPEGQSIFCDHYNAQTKMYCKRLKAMCPEHEKEKKINDDEVCGCPLYKKDRIFEDSNEICLASKRNCQLHFKWEKLRRAQIDLEKLHLMMKLEELYEQKRMIDAAMSNRNGVLGLMLHKTIVH